MNPSPMMPALTVMDLLLRGQRTSWPRPTPAWAPSRSGTPRGDPAATPGLPAGRSHTPPAPSGSADGSGSPRGALTGRVVRPAAGAAPGDPAGASARRTAAPARRGG